MRPNSRCSSISTSFSPSISSIGGTPSWLLILFDRLAALRGEKRLPLARFWPNLELVVPQIKQLVANGIEGLVYDKVSVALFPVDGAAVTAGGDRAYLTQVAGLWIHETSAAQARWLIGALAVASILGLVAAGVFAWLWRRGAPAGNAA